MNGEDRQILIRSLKKGNVKAFNQIFDLYAAKIYNFSLHHSLTSQDAEEVVQDTFAKIWEKRSLINPELSFEAYMIKIARNIIFDKLRRIVTERAFQSYYRYIQPVFDDTMEACIITKDLNEHENKIINKLPNRQKEVLLLKKDGYRNGEIAIKLGLSKSTVENHINMAIKELTKYFNALIFFLIIT